MKYTKWLSSQLVWLDYLEIIKELRSLRNAVTFFITKKPVRAAACTPAGFPLFVCKKTDESAVSESRVAISYRVNE